MSKQTSQLAQIQAIVPRPPMELEHKLPFARFVSVHTITGDASGGDVTAITTFKAANTYANFYLILTSLILYSNSGVAQAVSIYLSATHWTDFPCTTGAFTLLTAVLPIGTMQGFTPADSKSAFPIYIGRPAYAGTGRFDIYFPTNTDGKYYNTRLAGYLYGTPPYVSPHEVPLL